jgi:hypothetical protein
VARRAPRWLLAVAVAAILAGYATFHLWIVPPQGFYCGDQGAKFLQARATHAHGVLTPWIEGPALEIDRDHRFQEPFLLRRDGHLIGVFPWILSLVTAPFYGWLGMRGLYVVPALSAVVVLSRGVGHRPHHGAIARAVSAPARWRSRRRQSCFTVASSGNTAVGGGRARRAGAHRSRWIARCARIGLVRSIAAGVCLGAAAAFRPAALVAAPAVVIAILAVCRRRSSVGDIAALLLVSPRVRRDARRQRGDFRHGDPFQVTSNLALRLKPPVEMKLDIVRAIVLPSRFQVVFLAALALIPIAALALERQRRGLAHLTAIAPSPWRNSR